MVGGTLQHVRKSDVTTYPIPVPPLDEQKRIVEAVEERLERVERLEKSVENIDKLTEEYEKSLLSFLTLGQDPDTKTPVADTPEKSQLPDGWNVTQISEVANVNPRISFEEQKDYAYVPMDAVSANKKVITRYERRDSLYSGLAKFSQGDIVVARITPCFENGKMAIASDLPDGYGFAVGSTEFVVIRPTDINTEYLFSYLKSPIVRQWGKHRLLGATGRERIKISQFRDELTVPVPPEEVQSQIVQNIKKNDFDKIRTSVNTVQNMFREYDTSVLATALNGNI
jgi:type I restriction enzyme S subunit